MREGLVPWPKSTGLSEPLTARCWSNNFFLVSSALALAGVLGAACAPSPAVFELRLSGREMPKIRAVQLNGNLLEADCPSHGSLPANIGDLKVLLGAADPVKTPACFVKLLQPENGMAELADMDDIPWHQLSEDSKLPLTYLAVADIEAMMGMILPYPRYETISRVPEEVAQMFVDAWSCLLKFSHATVNEVDQAGSTQLVQLLETFERVAEMNFEHSISDEAFDNFLILLVEYIQCPSLQLATIDKTIPCFGKQRLWNLVREKKPRRNSRSHGGMRGGAQIVQAFVQRGSRDPIFGPRANDGDNLLQYILEPTSLGHAGDKSLDEARLCVTIASHSTLADLCHVNLDCYWVGSLDFNCLVETRVFSTQSRKR